jgi:isocitrate dehydrogenase (NAD+)
MMLRHIGKAAEADKLENAAAAVIAEGRDVTYDMKEDRDDPTAVGTQEMAEAIIARIKKGS